MAGDLKQRIVRVGLVTGKESLVVDKVELDAVHFCLQNAHILASPVEVHVEVCDIFHFILHLLLHAGILGHNDPDIVKLLVELLGKRTDNICQTTGFDKRNAFRCHEKNLLHIK